jgi:hypothetical protein
MLLIHTWWNLQGCIMPPEWKLHPVLCQQLCQPRKMTSLRPRQALPLPVLCRRTRAQGLPAALLLLLLLKEAWQQQVDHAAVTGAA